MALVTEKSIFLHVPKACGMWVRHAFKVNKIVTEELGEQHSHFPELLRFKPPEFFQKRFVFAFVRHPLTWYQSRWAFRMKTGWKARHPLDYNCASNHFSDFVDRLINYKPDGWFSWECRMFIDQSPRPLDFIGRCESLVDDTIKALQMANEQFSEKLVRSIPRINDSDLDGKSSKFWAPYSRPLANRVMAVEHEVMNRYYADGQFDVDGLIANCPY